MQLFYCTVAGQIARLFAPMPGYNLVPAIILLAQRDGRNDTTLFYALNQLIHILI